MKKLSFSCIDCEYSKNISDYPELEGDVLEYSINDIKITKSIINDIVCELNFVCDNKLYIISYRIEYEDYAETVLNNLLSNWFS